MTASRPSAAKFRARLTAGEHVLGTFIKTPTSHTTEIVGSVGFDFVIIDQEHAPFDRGTIDVACLAARAVNTAAIVRVAEPTAAAILSVLDVGAAGVMIPHVDSPAKAKEMAAACRYKGGSRGFSNTTRAGNWGGATFDGHIAEQDATVACIAMIEDEGALAHLPAIMAVPGIDAVFLGRGDLTAAIGAAGMKTAVGRITAAARGANRRVMALVSSREDARDMREQGVTAFVVSNDQSFLKAAATQALKDYGDPKAW